MSDTNTPVGATMTLFDRVAIGGPAAVILLYALWQWPAFTMKMEEGYKRNADALLSASQIQERTVDKVLASQEKTIDRILTQAKEERELYLSRDREHEKQVPRDISQN